MQNQEGAPDHLRRQLAVAVRSVQWSYAIFWSLSTKQQGTLEWGDGYYNGDIKTRKTVREMELKPDKMGLQRSEQLRELYECLLEGESDQQAKKPAALSPDDLSDAEWYYMVCMSFVFNHGQGLPGRALETNKAVWLCNAHSADCKVFFRSLLAKSASIQTVMCFPYLGGVIELGVTDLVLEDPSLIQHVKASLLEFSKPVCSEKSSSAPHKKDGDADFMYVKVDNEEVGEMALEKFYSTKENKGFEQVNELEGNIQEEFTIGSSDDCSAGCEHNNQTEDSFLLEGANGGASQVHSWHFMKDDFSNCVHESMNSSDCISQAFINQEKVTHPLKTINKNITQLKKLQECNHTKLSSLDLGNDEDLHYQKTLSAILINNSHRLLDSLYSRSNVHKSCFMRWTKRENFKGHKSLVSQQMVKKILINVPLMHSFGLIKSEKGNNREGEGELLKLESGDILVECPFPNKMENEKFLVLRSIVPTISKIDKASILGDTIEYLKELEARVEELESCIDLSEHEERARKKFHDMVEKISDNYENGSGSSKRAWVNKRKASDIDESSDPELSSVVPKNGPLLDIKVSVKENEVLIQMSCPWREYLLLDIIDALNNLDMEAHSVQSSTVDGILTVTLQSKFRGAAVASDRMIRRTLSTIAGKC